MGSEMCIRDRLCCAHLPRADDGSFFLVTVGASFSGSITHRVASRPSNRVDLLFTTQDEKWAQRNTAALLLLLLLLQLLPAPNG